MLTEKIFVCVTDQLAYGVVIEVCSKTEIHVKEKILSSILAIEAIRHMSSGLSFEVHLQLDVLRSL